MLDKLAYSILWLIGLFFMLGKVVHKTGLWWDVAFWVLIVMIATQMVLVAYNFSDMSFRRRVRNKLRGW